VFIPAKIKDNPTLLQNDPLYIARLRMVGNDQLVDAWLNGNWDIIEGAFFTEWNLSRHCLIHKEVERKVNSDWRFFLAGDWGSARPFSFGWYGIVPHETWIMDRRIPRGALIRVREYYDLKKGEFNVGVKMHAEAVAREIKDRTREPLLYGVLDPSAFKQDGGPSIAERMAGIGVRFRPADNRRLARKGSLGGWDMCRFRLTGEEDSEPMFFVTEASPHFIRTIPVIQHDKLNMEDLDTEAEDHIADEWRYGMMSRPWVPTKYKKPKETAGTAQEFWRGITFDQKEPMRIRL
jgi:hypothetical protein